jgi:hypothetical protein
MVYLYFAILIRFNLTTINDLDGLRSLPVFRANLFHSVQNLIALNHLAKDNVATIKPWSFGEAHEELTSIGVLKSINNHT